MSKSQFLLEWSLAEATRERSLCVEDSPEAFLYDAQIKMIQAALALCPKILSN